MRITSKLPQVGVTIFSAMSALAQECQAVNLSQGFPNFDPDERLQALVSEHMRKGANQYAPMPGLPRLRERIAEKMARCYGLALNPDTEITVTAGGTQALFCAFAALVQPGDEVILIEPCYDSYRPSIETMGGIVRAHTLQGPDYRLDWEAIGQLITPRTRMLCINTPHNPTGAVWSHEDMLALERLLRPTDIVLLSDEVYEHLTYDGLPHRSALAYPGLRERALCVYSFGKTYHCTGWKIGYCIAAPALSAEFRKVHQFNVFCANHPMQAAFADFMEDASAYEGLSAFYQQKRDLFLQALASTPLRPLPCQGSYFQLCAYGHLSAERDVDFCVRLTREYKVAAIPVSVFYSNNRDEQVVRFCFAKTDDVLHQAGDLLARLH